VRDTGERGCGRNATWASESAKQGERAAGLRHGYLRVAGLQEYDTNNNASVITQSSNREIMDLWKAVEKQENFVSCCSGCAGDYEDPDWSAWEPDPVEQKELDDKGEELRDEPRA